MKTIGYFRKKKYFLLWFLIFTFSSCLEQNTMKKDDPFIRSINKIIEDAKKMEGDKRFDFLKADEAEWDKLYIFGPYTPTAEIEKQLKNTHEAIRKINIEARDDITLLVFTRQDAILTVFPFFRDKADFSQMVSHNPIFRQKSFFRLVEKTDEEGWFDVLIEDSGKFLP